MLGIQARSRARTRHRDHRCSFIGVR